MNRYSVTVVREWSGLETIQIEVYANSAAMAETQAELRAKKLPPREWTQVAITEYEPYAECIEKLVMPYSTILHPGTPTYSDGIMIEQPKGMSIESSSFDIQSKSARGALVKS